MESKLSTKYQKRQVGNLIGLKENEDRFITIASYELYAIRMVEIECNGKKSSLKRSESHLSSSVEIVRYERKKDGKFYVTASKDFSGLDIPLMIAMGIFGKSGKSKFRIEDDNIVCNYVEPGTRLLRQVVYSLKPNSCDEIV